MREVQFMSDFDENEKNSFRFVISFSSEFSFKKSKLSDKSKKIRSFSSLSAIFYVFNEKMLYDKKTMLKIFIFYKINFSEIENVFCLKFRFVIINLKTKKYAKIKFFVCHQIRFKTLIIWKFIKKNEYVWLNVNDWRQIEKLLKHHFETKKKMFQRWNVVWI